MNLSQTIRKDPEAVLDYSLDWAEWLDGDTIASVEWAVPDGLVLDHQENTTTVATVWLGGGVAGSNYSVSCIITTAAGRIDKRTFKLAARER